MTVQSGYGLGGAGFAGFGGELDLIPVNGLKAIYDAFLAALPLPIQPMPHFFGRLEQFLHDSPPRIGWVPSRDAYTRTIKSGRENGKPLQSYGTREIGVEIHIWGRDYLEVEAILREYLVLLKIAMLDSITFVGGWWITQMADGAALTNEGEIYVLDAMIATPIVLDAAMRGGMLNHDPRTYTWTTLTGIVNECCEEPCE